MLLYFLFVLIPYFRPFFFPPYFLIHASIKLSESGLVDAAVGFNAAIQTELVLSNKFQSSSASLVVLL